LDRDIPGADKMFLTIHQIALKGILLSCLMDEQDTVNAHIGRAIVRRWFLLAFLGSTRLGILLVHLRAGIIFVAQKGASEMILGVHI